MDSLRIGLRFVPTGQILEEARRLSMTDDERKAMVERIRKEASIQLGFDGPAYVTLTRWADQIEADGKRIAELEAALRDHSYSPLPSISPRGSMTENTLLPCPFCGGEAQFHTDNGPTGECYGWVGCNQCDAMSLHCDVRSMQPEDIHPIDAWNTRTENTSATEPVAWMYEYRGGVIAVTATRYDAGTIKALGYVETPLYATPTPAPQGEVERLREALSWYEEQVRLCRLIHSEGNAGRAALSDDGGKRARAALENDHDR